MGCGMRELNHEEAVHINHIFFFLNGASACVRAEELCDSVASPFLQYCIPSLQSSPVLRNCSYRYAVGFFGKGKKSLASSMFTNLFLWNWLRS